MPFVFLKPVKIPFIGLFSIVLCLLASTGVAQFTIPPDPCHVDSVLVIPPQCYGSCDGTIEIIARGCGQLTYTWQELPGVNSAWVDSLCEGMYHFTVSDSTGCVISDSVFLQAPSQIDFTLSVVNSTCPGGCSGSVTVVPADTFTYYFQWPGFLSTGPVLSNVCQGTYQVVITDVNGCTVLGETSVGYDNPFQLSFSSTDASCMNSCNGTATVFPGTNGTYNYQWDTGPIQSTQTAFNLCYGMNYVTVIDSAGCAVTDSVFIDLLPPDNFTFFTVDPDCFGGCNGLAQVVLSLPASGFSFTWATNPVQSDSIATGLCAGWYPVAVKNLQNGCVFVDSVEILNPAAPDLQFSTIPSHCENTCTGSVSAMTSAPAPVQYLWSTGSSSSGDSLLCTGLYTVTITDSVGCVSSASVMIGARAVDLVAANATCAGICNGSATVIKPPGSAWNMSWDTNPVSNTATIDSLCSGLYNVTLMDTSGCMLTGSTWVGFGNPIQVSSTVINESCALLCDGSTTLTITGNSPLTVFWNGALINYWDTISGLCRGTYELIVTDPAGCQLTDSVIVEGPSPVTVNYQITQNSCFGICDAMVNASVSAAGTFTWNWLTNPPQSGNVATGLCPGILHYTVTDSLGCSIADSVFIQATAPVFLNMNVTGVSCYGSCDGFANCQPWGGTPGYTYQWSNGFQTPQAVNLCPGDYTVTVTDMSGCTNSATVNIPEPPQLQVNFSIVHASCSGCSNGSVQANVTGGTPPYFYLWTPGGVGGPVLDNLLPGIYNLCVVDDNGCSWCDNVSVSFTSSMNITEAAILQSRFIPNPVTKWSSLTLHATEPLITEDLSFELWNVDGKRIRRNFKALFTNEPVNTRVYFENENLASGAYFYRIIHKGEVVNSGKLIILYGEE